jgi:hypothetical protein
VCCGFSARAANRDATSPESARTKIGGTSDGANRRKGESLFSPHPSKRKEASFGFTPAVNYQYFEGIGAGPGANIAIDQVVDFPQAEIGNFATEAIVSGATGATRAGDVLQIVNGAAALEQGGLALYARMFPKGEATGYTAPVYLFYVDAADYATFNPATQSVTVVIGGQSVSSAAGATYSDGTRIPLFHAGQLVEWLVDAGAGAARVQVRVDHGPVVPLLNTPLAGALAPTGAIDVLSAAGGGQFSCWLEDVAAFHRAPSVADLAQIHTEDLSPYQSIQGTDLEVLLNYQPKGASAPQDVNLLSMASLIGLSPSVKAALSTPLSAQFDTYWNAPVTLPNGASAPSPHDQLLQTLNQQLPQQIHNHMDSSYGAWGIVLNAPTSGTVSAAIDDEPGGGKLLRIDYSLGQVSANFSVTTPYTGGAITDPAFELDFDLDLTIQMDVPTSPCALNPTMTAWSSNAKISPKNDTATIGTLLGDLGNFLGGRPAAIFQSAEGAIDTYTNLPSTPFVGMLGGLQSACSTAQTQGFTEFAPFISQGTLGFRLTHPEEAPTVWTAGAGAPVLLTPQLAVSESQVFAGATDTAIGSQFPQQVSTNVSIAWSDPLGSVTTTNVVWGPVNGPQTTVTQNRTSFGGGLFTASNLTPNTFYQFTVQDCDVLTCSPVSNTLIAYTGTGSVALVLTTASGPIQVGTATLDPTSGFSTTITIPSNVPPGTYLLSAVVEGQTLATTGLTVIQGGQPTLEFYDAQSGTGTQGNQTCGSSPCWQVYWGSSISMKGEGWTPGPVTVVLNESTGPATYTTTASSAGEILFAISPDGYGNEVDTLTATESTPAGQLSRSLLISFVNQPK